MKLLENSKLKIVKSEDYNYIFDKTNGVFVRWGKTKEDDPVMAPSPEILDCEITTICGMGCQYCFPPGVLIETETGKIPIEQLKINQKVKSFSEKDKKNVDNTIVELYENPYDGVLITIEFEDGTTVKATPEHPFYVKGKGFIEARFLTEDMDIKTFC